LLASVRAKCPGSLSQVQYDALEEFYNSAGGPYWIFDFDLTKWTFPSSLSAPCTIPWEGINCTWSSKAHTECLVVSIELEYMNMSGTLSPYLGNLTSLQMLVLPNNTLSGQLPNELGLLTNLQYLYLPTNRLTGTIPTSLGRLAPLFYFAIYQNFVRGSIPTEIGLLTNLNMLALQQNELSGSIPSELGNLIGLQTFFLYENQLTFTIPSELGNLAVTNTFGMQANHLSGTIPSSLGFLTACYDFNWISNSLEGSIPSQLGLATSALVLSFASNLLTSYLPTEIGNMNGLLSFVGNNNYLSRSIPSQVGRMTSLEAFELYHNALSGSIASEVFGATTNLLALEISNNLLSGQIPTAIGDIVNVIGAFFQFNSLTGSLPSEVGSLASCLFFFVEENSLFGYLPTELGLMTSLQQLALGTNYFSGPFPVTLSQVTGISQVQVAQNFLTGSLPSELGLFQNVFVFFANGNLFTGTITSDVGSMVAAIQLYFSVNYFTSQLPSELSLCSRLLQLNADANFLSGEVPTSYGLLTALRSMNLSANMLSGTFMETLFMPPMRTTTTTEVPFMSLKLLDMSQNLLSGSLPDTLFNRTNASLQSLLLFENCFSGSIPSSLCASTDLADLVLDSLSSVGSCSVNIAPALRPIVKAVFSRMRLHGSVPSCLWNMSKLQVLHLASNGLTGTLGEITSPYLSDVSLSNNDLYGAIPHSFQEFSFFNQLDLSNNKFSGVLSRQFTVNESSTQLDLTVNRLSGQIPSDLYDTRNLNILNGNLFQCQTDNMPRYDPSKKSADCGSKNLNDAIIVWGTFGLLAVGCLFLLPLAFIPQAVEFHNYLQTQQTVVSQRGGSLKQCVNFLKLLRILTGAVVAVTGFAVICCLFVYIDFKNSDAYSTHSQQYAWATTASFLHGLTPAAVCILFFLVAAWFMNNLMIWYVNTNVDWEDRRKTLASQRDTFVGGLGRLSTLEIGNSLQSILPEKKYWQVAGILLTHTTVTITINVLYVLALLDQRIGSDAIIVIQLLLSAFKLIWVYGMGKCLRRVEGISKFSRLVAFFSLYLMSFMVGPFIATFFSEDTCFHEIIAGQDAVTSQFTINVLTCPTVCVQLSCTTTCGFTQPVTIVTTVTPSWIYSFQCSSSLLLDYVPVFILSYTLTGLILPALSLIVSHPLVILDHSLLLDKSVRYRLSEMLIGVHSAALHGQQSQLTIVALVSNLLWGKFDDDSYLRNRKQTDLAVSAADKSVVSRDGTSIVTEKEVALNSEFDHRCSELEQRSFRGSNLSNTDGDGFSYRNTDDNDRINYLYRNRMGSGGPSDDLGIEDNDRINYLYSKRMDSGAGDTNHDSVEAGPNVKFAGVSPVHSTLNLNQAEGNKVVKKMNITPDHMYDDSIQSTVDLLPTGDANRVFDTSHVIAKFFVNWTILLTFGLASPILAVTVAVDSCAMILLWRVTLRRCLDRIMQPADSTKDISSSLHQGLLASEDSRTQLLALQRLENSSEYTLNGIKFCVFMMIVSSSWYWSLFIFDMVGDFYGYQGGGFAVLTLILFVPCALLLNNCCIQWWYEGRFDWLWRS
jgi:Leucine-rich repeat (LRR) protein